MSKRQLAVLFFCSLVSWIVGAGALPLLPVYAATLGASSTIVGLYLSFCYVAVSIGAMLSDWLSRRLSSRRILYVIVGLVAAPAMWMVGRVGSLWSLSLLTAFVWFCGGLGIGLTNILAGLFAEPQSRGKAFGILALANPLGLLIGGASTGSIVDQWGYPAMFTALAAVLALWVLAGPLLKDKPIEANPSSKADPQRADVRPSARFYIFAAATVIGWTGGFVSNMVRSLSMDELGFSATAISSTIAVAGAAILPLPPLTGWLSDRLNRKALLIAGYVVLAVSLLLLRASSMLWQFYIAVTLTYIANAVLNAVGPAQAADLLREESMGVGMSLYSATGVLGGALGFAAAGPAIQYLGVSLTLAIAACLPLAASVMIAPIRREGVGTQNGSSGL